MDQICRRFIDDATDAFIASIDRSKICDLASALHPERKPCRIFCEPMKRGYNIWFSIVILSDKGDTDEKLVIRIPLTLRLAFPEEKMQRDSYYEVCALLSFFSSLLRASGLTHLDTLH
jgi:hypothetical protein